MTQTISISIDDRTAKLINENKGGLTRSEYIQECLLNYWEHIRIKQGINSRIKQKGGKWWTQSIISKT